MIHAKKINICFYQLMSTATDIAAGLGPFGKFKFYQRFGFGSLWGMLASEFKFWRPSQIRCHLHHYIHLVIIMMIIG